jgi:hypothetical protein
VFPERKKRCNIADETGREKVILQFQRLFSVSITVFLHHHHLFSSSRVQIALVLLLDIIRDGDTTVSSVEIM